MALARGIRELATTAYRPLRFSSGGGLRLVAIRFRRLSTRALASSLPKNPAANKESA